jgi:hypothetical protein
MKSMEEREARQDEMKLRQEALERAPEGAAFERHYTVHQLAKQWNMSYEKARNIVRQEAGVCKIGLPGKRKSYRVAESTARRIYARLQAG